MSEDKPTATDLICEGIEAVTIGRLSSKNKKLEAELDEERRRRKANHQVCLAAVKDNVSLRNELVALKASQLQEETLEDAKNGDWHLLECDFEDGKPPIFIVANYDEDGNGSHAWWTIDGYHDPIIKRVFALPSPPEQEKGEG